MEEKKKTKKTTAPTEKKEVDMVEKLKAKVSKLEERLVEKQKEFYAMEEELEEKNGHLQFMNNSLSDDVERYKVQISELQFENDRLKTENGYLLSTLDGSRFLTFKERMRVLFKGRYYA